MTVRNFKEIWEKQEVASLTKDRDRKLELLNADPETIAAADEANANDMQERMDSMMVNEDYFQPNANAETEKTVLY
jgi:hypothetical protein